MILDISLQVTLDPFIKYSQGANTESFCNHVDVLLSSPNLSIQSSGIFGDTLSHEDMTTFTSFL